MAKVRRSAADAKRGVLRDRGLIWTVPPAARFLNPKPETRDPKHIRNPKAEGSIQRGVVWVLDLSPFLLSESVSDIGLQISDLPTRRFCSTLAPRGARA